MFVCCERRVLSGRGLCDELITCPEESYRMWCVVVCDLEISRIGAPYIYIYIYIYDISSLRVNIITLASSYSALHDDGDYTKTCWSCFNVNFNTPFKAILLFIT